MALARSRIQARPRNTGPDVATIGTVLARDGYRCVRCGYTVHWPCCASIHHRKPRGMGGGEADNTPANLILLCGTGTTGCHGQVESRRAEALESGWLVSRYADPASVAVLVDHGSRWVYLSASGEYVDDPPVVSHVP